MSAARKIGYGILIGAGCAMAFVGLLAAAQSKLIYHPRSYTQFSSYYTQLRKKLPLLEDLKYVSSSSGTQFAYYLPPVAAAAVGAAAARTAAEPFERKFDQEFIPTPQRPRVWLCFGGNAALARDWTDFLVSSRASTPTATEANANHFLLIEYPGYGQNQGVASPSAAVESVEEAIAAFAARLKLSHEALAQQFAFGILAHSLGCGVAGAFAAKQVAEGAAGSTRAVTIDRLVLNSPFTSILEMSYRIVGPLPGLRSLISHEYDTRESLAAIAHAAASRRDASSRAADVVRAWPVSITILHGARDEVVPVSMGRALNEMLSDYARSSPSTIVTRYVELPRVDHNSILQMASREIWDAMYRPL